MLQAVHGAAIPAPVPVWTLADLQAAILMVPRPFTTCRLVQRSVPRCHQLFAYQNATAAMRQLQSCGLGATVQLRKNQTAFHKPLPTAQNKAAVERIIAPTYSWPEYLSCFCQLASHSMRPTLFNTLLRSSPYAAQLKDRYNIAPAVLEPHCLTSPLMQS